MGPPIRLHDEDEPLLPDLEATRARKLDLDHLHPHPVDGGQGLDRPRAGRPTKDACVPRGQQRVIELDGVATPLSAEKHIRARERDVTTVGRLGGFDECRPRGPIGRCHIDKYGARRSACWSSRVLRRPKPQPPASDDEETVLSQEGAPTSDERSIGTSQIPQHPPRDAPRPIAHDLGMLR